MIYIWTCLENNCSVLWISIIHVYECVWHLFMKVYGGYVLIMHPVFACSVVSRSFWRRDSLSCSHLSRLTFSCCCVHVWAFALARGFADDWARRMQWCRRRKDAQATRKSEGGRGRSEQEGRIAEEFDPIGAVSSATSSARRGSDSMCGTESLCTANGWMEY